MLSAMTMHGWVPGPGDNDWLGWACTIAYFFSAGACAFAWRRDRRRPKLWMTILVILVLLGINKQLDLQLLIARVGKEIVMHEGWREKWKLVQTITVVMLGLAAIVSFVLLLKYVGSAWRKYWVPLGGLVALGVFVLLRAGAHVPRMEEINMRFYRGLHVLELFLVLVIGTSALITSMEGLQTPAPTAS